MLSKEDIRNLVAQCGGVHEVSLKTGLRSNTIYRLMSGANNPSYNTSALLEELRQNELINS